MCKQNAHKASAMRVKLFNPNAPKKSANQGIDSDLLRQAKERHNNPETKQTIPCLLDIQADLLDNLTTRVVVPLITASALGNAAKHLNPQFKIKRTAMLMSTSELAGVTVQVLGEKAC